MIILGISCFYHDASACLVRDGKIIRAAQQERFSRIKNDANFPWEAARFCLDGLQEPVDAVAFYDNPALKRLRAVEIARTYGLDALDSLTTSLANWWKLDALSASIQELLGWTPNLCEERLHFVEHHLSHAASAYYCSGFESAAILTLDGVGEMATTTIGRGRNDQIELLRQINYPHSLGLYYSAFTSYLGFKVNSGEYKVMGLAPLGNPTYHDVLKKHVINLRTDGSFQLNLDYFRFHLEETMTNAKALEKLLGLPARRSSDPLTQAHKDLAASVQTVLEEAFVNLLVEAKRLTGEDAVCLAGGVALNCSAVGKMHAKGILKKHFTQPAAGDAGGSMGAALEVFHCLSNANKLQTPSSKFSVYLGPTIIQSDAELDFSQKGYPFHEFIETDLISKIADCLSKEMVVGWCRGRMEWGPRALGARSILASPLKPGVQKDLNLRIKKRESFRPFAPMVLEKSADLLFDKVAPTPHMTCVYFLKPELRDPASALSGDGAKLSSEHFQHLKAAVIHRDWSARLQTVTSEDNDALFRLLEEFQALSGSPMLVNTSFNVRGEPIICDHLDAYRCFMRAELDVLVVENLVLFRSEQPPLAASELEIFDED